MPRIGIDLGGTKIEAVLMADNGSIEARRRFATPRHDYTATVDVIAGVVAELDAVAGHRCLVGAGTPGTLDPVSRLMKNCNSTWLNGRPLHHDLERRLGERVRIANDADCFALSEAADGAGRDARVVFGVILGTGVGGGIVVDRALLAGPNGIAGEWGHNPLPYLRAQPHADPVESRLADRPCYCGRSNCVEAYLSGPGIARTHAELWDEECEPRSIADARDARRSTTLEVYCRQLARSLAQIINVVDPHVIVLGGGLSEVSVLYRRVPELWRACVFSDKVETRLLPALHGAASGVRGAAWLWPADDLSEPT